MVVHTTATSPSRHCEVLLHGGLLRKPQAGVAAFIHDSLNDHIAHLIRTPQVIVCMFMCG